MRPPLGSTLDNFFLTQMEKRILETSSNHHPLLYLRFVDVMFAVFDNNESCSKFMYVLNSQHKNIKFSLETLCF